MIYRLIALLLFLATVPVAAEHPPAPEPLLPAYFNNLQLGISLEEFSKLKDVESMSRYEGFDFRLELSETIKDPELTRVTYYFDQDDHKPLYELIIEYVSGETAVAAAKKLLGEPNHDGEWRFTKDGVVIRAWQFAHKLVVVAEFPKTSFHPDEEEKVRKQLEEEGD